MSAVPPHIPRGARKVTQQGSTFWVIGDQLAPLRDAFHTFLRAPWPVSLLLIALGFFAVNLVFAVIYLYVGGYGGDGSFFDALSFSVQTMATIGYGVMHPQQSGATTVMIVESMMGIVVTALATGLVFAKFSRPTTRIQFSSCAVITPFDGKPTLIFRVGNRRGNIIVEAQLHVVALMTTVTAEGETFYRAHDLRLVRARQLGLTRGWTVMHVIDETSPLHGLDAAKIEKAELELQAVITGTDDITMQSVLAMHAYQGHQIRIGYRFEDSLTTYPDGSFVIDLRKFDAVVPDATPRVSVPA